MAAHWTLAETIEWIAKSTPALDRRGILEGLQEKCRAGLIEAIGNRHSRATGAPAFLHGRDLAAWMRDAGSFEAEFKPIPTHEWKSAEWRRMAEGSLQGGLDRDGIPSWSNVLFPASDVMKNWPQHGNQVGRRRGAPRDVSKRVEAEMLKRVRSDPGYLAKLKSAKRDSLAMDYNCGGGTAWKVREAVLSQIDRPNS